MPSDYKKYFWDVDFNKLSIHKDRDYIVSRILTLGNFESVSWLLSTYSKENLTESLLNKNISSRTKSMIRGIIS